jgi:hypothetical protein
MVSATDPCGRILGFLDRAGKMTASINCILCSPVATIENLIAVAITTVLLWDITLCSHVELHRRFGGAYCLHLLVDIVRVAI